MRTQVQIEEVARGIWRLSLPIPYPLKHVHGYLLRGDGAALVDTGLKAGALEAALAELGLGFGDLDAVFITHHHPDHYALAGRLEAQGAQVLMLEEEIRRGHAFWTDFETWRDAGHWAFLDHGVPEAYIEGFAREMDETRKRVFPPESPRGLQDGQTVELAGMRFRVLATPGHAEGQAALYREDGVLIAGDAILDRVSPIIARWAYSNPDPLADFLGTLERLAELEVGLTLSGHFNPPTSKPEPKPSNATTPSAWRPPSRPSKRGPRRPGKPRSRSFRASCHPPSAASPGPKPSPTWSTFDTRVNSPASPAAPCATRWPPGEAHSDQNDPQVVEVIGGGAGLNQIPEGGEEAVGVVSGQVGRGIEAERQGPVERIRGE